MPQRRANDAQVERLLQAMRSREYRQALARKVANLPASGKLPAKGTDSRRAYDSATRRFERYVTTAGEKRSFAGASATARKPIIVAARRVSLPANLPPAKPKAVPLPQEPSRPLRERPAFLPTVEPARFESVYEEPERWPVDLYDLRAILAYHDGDAKEAAEQLREAGDLNATQERRIENMLELAASGVDVLSMRSAGAMADAYHELIESLPSEDQQDVEDFSALLHDLPDWQIQMIIEDMQNGDTTFSDWMDAWHDANMDIDNDENEYWKLWREAYARAKK